LGMKTSAMAVRFEKANYADGTKMKGAVNGKPYYPLPEDSRKTTKPNK